MARKYIENYLKAHNLTKEDWLACSECGGTAVDLHHIVKRSQGGTDNPSNLKPLCRLCHLRHHA